MTQEQRNRVENALISMIENIPSVSVTSGDAPKSVSTAIYIGKRYECNLSLMANLLDMESEIDFENDSQEDVRKELLRAESYGKPCSAARLLLCAAYSMSDSERNGYYSRDWKAKTGLMETKHVGNEGLDRLYALLTELGYQASQEELQMREGTHELFQAGGGV